MSEDQPKLKFSPKIGKCMLCGKPTHFYVTVEEESYSAEFWYDERDGKFRVVSELAFKEPDKHYYAFPTCPECYKKGDSE